MASFVTAGTVSGLTSSSKFPVKYIVIGTVAGAGAVAAPLAAPVILGAAGFTSAGITAGSLGASMMSASATTGIGAGVVAVCQSAGAAGLSLAATALTSITGFFGGASAAGVISKLASKKSSDEQAQQGDVPRSTYQGRRLGFTETLDHHFLNTHCVGINYHVAVVHASEALQDSDVIKTCKILARKQKTLQMCIKPSKEDNPYEQSFVPMADPEDISFVAVTLKNKDKWPAFIVREDENKIDCENGPLWKVVLARLEQQTPGSNECLFVFKVHSSVSDEKSLFDMVYRQFLPILSSVMSQGDSDEVIPDIPQPPSIEDHFLTDNSPLSFKLNVGLNFSRWKNRQRRSSNRVALKFPGEFLSTDSDQVIEPQCVHRLFDGPLGRAIVRSSWHHQVSPHSVLVAACAVAFCRAANGVGVRISFPFKLDWVVNLREFLSYQSPQPLAAIRGHANISCGKATNVTMQEFWKYCKNIKDEEGQKKTIEKCCKDFGVAKYVIESAAETPLPTIVSELGVETMLSLSELWETNNDSAPIMTSDAVKLRMTEHYHMVTGLSKLDLPMSQYMTCLKGNIMWNVVYSPQRVSRRFVDEYLDQLEAALASYCIY